MNEEDLKQAQMVLERRKREVESHAVAVQEADRELTRLKLEAKDVLKFATDERHKVEQEKEVLRLKSANIDDVITKTSATWSKQSEDLGAEKVEFEKAKADFELEKATIASDLNKLEIAKSDHTLTLQKLEKEHKAVDALKLKVVAERRQLEQDRFNLKAKEDDLQKRQAEESSRLKKLALDLKHQELELQAKLIDLGTASRIEHLEKKVKGK